MTTDLFLALVAFALVSSITPGPNNMMLLSSGLTFGFRRTIPHMLGVSFGHAAMLFAIGLGLGEVFARAPLAYTVLKVVGAAYMIWLAWKIAHASPVQAGAGDAGGEGSSKPFTFIQAALFQWVNPKGVLMAVTAVTVYTSPDDYLRSLVLAGLTFLLTNQVSVGAWAFFGSALRTLMSDPKKVRWFNIGMALLLLASLVPMLR